ncbi:MAG: DUF2313 domain-containing protein [Oxalobacter formigenes]|nr:DUF2313 domain-containing protein [Oxalobacter formigenes]
MGIKEASVEDYRHALAALMPPGPAFAETDELLEGLAAEFARCHNRMIDLIRETDPRTTSELISEWETDAGLPDPCDEALGKAETLSERQRILCAKLLSTGGQSAAYYEAIAKALGYEVSVRGYRPHTVESSVDEPLTDQAWAFAFRIHAPEKTIFYSSVEDGVDTPLAWWGDGRLECIIRRLKQTHTTPIFIYGE